MQEEKLQAKAYILPPLVIAGAVLLWGTLAHFPLFGVWADPPAVFTSPLAVAKGFGEEFPNGLLENIIASVFRVSLGFGLATVLGVPLGLWLGLNNRARLALLPIVNFFRSLSPLAWIPFAIFWFGV